MSEDDTPKSGDSSGRSGPPRRRRRRSRRRPGKAEGPATADQASPQSGKSREPRRRRRARKQPADAPGQKEKPRAREDGDRDPARRRRRRRRSRGRARAGASREAHDTRTDRRSHQEPSTHGREPRSAAQKDAELVEPARSLPAGVSEVDLGWDDEPVAMPTVAAEADLDDDDTELEVDDDGTRYGDDSDAPTPDITLSADLPSDPPADDPDPVSAELEEAELRDSEVRNVVGVRFARAGKIYLYDGGEQSYRRGETVILESDRGIRVGQVAVASVRRPHRDPPLRRILRRADHNDVRATLRAEDRAREALIAAREQVRSLGMSIKVFRAEAAQSGRKVRLYFSSEDRADFRGLVRELSRNVRSRVEMRQTGVRDQAKMVGGIGSCGRTLCCSSWLPDFVPVSIKNAKDQGLVLNPSKVSGQCGRLKCCLVYEQEAYAELRKGLPKMGKRVVTEAGEGRVVEVDVLKQRVRVSLTSGESVVYGAGEVEPMFPSQKPKKPRRKSQQKSDPDSSPDSQQKE